MILIDANVILDVWDRDPVWHAWSRDQMRKLSVMDELAINPIIYAEISVRFATPAALDEKLDNLGAIVESIPRRAAFLAGKAYLQYRRLGGTKSNVLPDFFIGAHAAVLGCPLLTRDTRRYAANFPTVRLIAPPPIC
ncbi:MAG: type II toxin-antitoxin system VapC family toxin [Terracidiphilus sp.]